ncbi:RNA polymerase sigma factor [Cellulomonas rhizosphaerae]|uniref:Sigma-70 family RNA polymerase sigma factor n=1 Tax=Cellulomonas rhizosphaerae TaxID=2293719 RepID=A0A413RNK7_9CELL|nr:sigma-70 family RNA polymerase sigma factor [Cellulomonas rhizosphaerae]RHA43547.1 sigma-70 family RNA polymerase sigma factor [Cellulomonas rhizosphaerae]
MLLEAVPSSPAAEFEALFRAVAPGVRRFVARTVGPDAADDVVNETFATVWRRWSELPCDEGMRRAWIYKTAHYECGHALRSRGRRQRTADRVAAGRHVLPDETERVLGDDRVTRLLADLPATDRDALELVVWGGLTPSEAAFALGCSPTAMRARLMRARRRVEKALGDEQVRQGVRP